MSSSFRGAVDLTELANKVVKERLESTSTVSVDPAAVIKLPALSIELAEPNLRAVLEVSSHVAVVVIFYSPENQESLDLQSKLEKLTQVGEKRWLLAKLDILANPKIAQAFGVDTPATVAIILEGEPSPVFVGDQPDADLTEFIRKLVEVAKGKGINSVIEVQGDSEISTEPVLSESEQAALDAMDRGEFGIAVGIYEAELRINPNNALLAERLAQVKLVERTFNGDMERELGVVPETISEAMRKADFMLAIGRSEEAFDLLLTFFETAKSAERPGLSAFILDLIMVLGKAHPVSIEARKKLAGLMF